MAPIDFEIERLSDADIAERASDLRRRYYDAMGTDGTPAFPVKHLVSEFLSSRAGIDLDLDGNMGDTDGGDKIAGSLTVGDVGGIVRIDRAVAASPMLPFTLAHEVGHIVLHEPALRKRFLEMQTRGDQAVPLVTLRRDIGGGKGNPLEWQANRFAVHLLMPAELVALEFRRRFGTVSRRHSDQAELSPSFAKSWPLARDYARFLASKGQSSNVTGLSQAFAVSIEAMAIRLQELGWV